MAEISDATLAEYQRAHNLLRSLYDDSKVGMDFRKMIKAKYPGASIPELDAITKTEELGSGIHKQFQELGEGLQKKIDGFLSERTKEKEEAAVSAFASSIDKIVKDRGYTKDGEAALLSLMKERNIHDPEDAAIIFESRQPKPPRARRDYSSRMNFISPSDKDDEQFKRLMEDPEQFMVDELMTAIGNADRE